MMVDRGLSGGFICDFLLLCYNGLTLVNFMWWPMGYSFCFKHSRLANWKDPQFAIGDSSTRNWPETMACWIGKPNMGWPPNREWYWLGDQQAGLGQDAPLHLDHPHVLAYGLMAIIPHQNWLVAVLELKTGIYKHLLYTYMHTYYI